MKKRFIGRLAATLLLAGAFAFGFTACGSDDAPAPAQDVVDDVVGDVAGDDAAATDETPDAPPAEGRATTAGPLEPFSETVTINWGIATDAGQNFFDDDNWDDNRWSRRILEDLNVNLEVAFTADGPSGAFDDAMRLRLVAGDLPNIFATWDRLLFAQAHEAGLLMEIGSLMNQYATPAVLEYKTLFEESFQGGSLDGVLYGFPTMNDSFHSGNYLWIRDDWLENTGTTPPTTVDEFIELARTFTFGDPNGDGSQTFGFGMHMDVSQNIGMLLGAHGVPSAWGGTFYRRNGEITFSLIQPEVVYVLEILNYFYEEGIIDPEFFVKTMTNLEGDLGQNMLGMFDYRNWGTWYPFNILFEDTGVITRPYPIPTVPGVDYKIGIDNNAGGLLFVMAADTEYPEAFVQILNLYNLLVFESTDADDFHRYWAEGQAGLAPVRPIVPNEIFAPLIWDAIETGNSDLLPAHIRQFYEFTRAFEEGTDTSGQAFGTWGQNFERGSMAIALVDYTRDGALVQNVMGAYRPQVFLDNASIMGDLINTTFIEFIRGQRSLDTFDGFVQDWLANGGQATLDALSAQYPE